MAVCSGGDPHIAVPHQPLDAMSVDALAKQLGSERVPQIVKAHLDMNCRRPEEPPAQLRSRVPSAIRSLDASRTVARQVVAGADCVPAPSAAVLVAIVLPIYGSLQPARAAPTNCLSATVAGTEMPPRREGSHETR